MRAPSLKRLVSDFLDAIAAERGASANTLQAYAHDLDDYVGFLGERATDALRAKSDDVSAYLAARAESGLGAATLARRLSAIRQFHKHLYAEARRRDDPTLALEGPRRGRPLPKILAVAEVERILAAAREGIDAPDRPKSDRLAAARTACLVELIYASGLRVSEALSLPKSAARNK